MPAELKYTEEAWKELAIPQKKKSEVENCNRSGKVNVNENYDKCHTFDINFIDLPNHTSKCYNVGKFTCLETQINQFDKCCVVYVLGNKFLFCR